MSGSVTSPTGSVKGVSVAGLLDAYAGNFGGSALTIPPQWQHVALLSNQAGACSREGSGGSYGGSEVTVRLTMLGYRDAPAGVLPPVYPPAADLPLTFTANAWLVTSDGVSRVVNPYFMQATRNGGAGTAVQASAGTVTYTRMDNVQYEGSYDLYWGSDHATGSFVAPWCGTAP